ncbi:hypothetical protein ACN38_g3481 [Penicillium nordicum]|uniref:Uncharacterized protein n=1 Tax=Penicillium nordicum TaxID=229535 RepID=A0A0N0RZE8_9EURO|nr:hypothetical protein ACN38_g3481 [Penicillium nordicum]
MGRDDVKLGEERELIAMDGEKLLDIYLPGEGFMPEAPMWSLRPPQHECGPEQNLGPNIYTATVIIGGSDCPYDLLTE